MEIRAARDAELDQVVALQCARNGPECDGPLQALWRREDVGPERFAVAVEAGRVVSSLCLLPERLRISGVDFAAAQVGYVATAEGAGHRGLVRSLMALAHSWCEADGRPVQLIAGIPYFYRRFGYEYALPFAPVRLLDPGAPAPMPAGHTVRPAGVDDAAAIVASQRAACDAADVAVLSKDEAWWRWWLGTGCEPGWRVVERDGRVVGTGRIGDGPPGVAGVSLASATAGDAGALRALVAEAAAVPNLAPAFEERPPLTSLLEGVSHRHPRSYAVYVRVADPVALLDALRPALSRRLAASPRADFEGPFLVSLYATSVVLHVAGGEVVRVEAGGPEQAPASRGGIGVPPDLFATLVLGRYGATGLAARFDDVQLGRRADLSDALFPALTSDVSLL